MTSLQWNSSLVKSILLFCIIFSGKSFDLYSLASHNKSASDSIKIELNVFNLPVYYPSTGIQFYRDGIIYLIDSKFLRESKGEYVPFGRISMYYSPFKDNKIGKQIYFLRTEPFPYPAEAVSFTADYSKMFFTQESVFREPGDNTIRIYEAEISVRNDGKTDLKRTYREFPFNSKMYSCVQPAVSPDEKFLIFASDMPGGHGGLDLYYSIYENGIWGDPINLGKDINSNLDESSSFIDNNGNLFFSSNGHEGLGKYDIYFAKLIKPFVWGKPKNMGPQLNSEKNDVAFVLSRIDETQGFFASDRNDSEKKYQIFRVKMSDDIDFLSQDQAPESESQTQTLIDTLKTSDKTIDKAKIEETGQSVIVQAESEQTKPEIIFRVQFKTSAKSLGSFNIVIDGKEYKAFEYVYKGAYRYTIGEFEKLEDAKLLDQSCKLKGYSDAFVAAFKGSERILDPQVLK